MINRRVLLTAMGAAASMAAIGSVQEAAAAIAPMHDRVTAALADWTAEGNPARERSDFDPEVFSFMMQADLLVEQDWRFVYPNDPGPTYWMRREAIRRGQVALAYRISPQAGDMMQDFMAIKVVPPQNLGRPFRDSDFARLDAIAKTRKRVYLGPPVGGALPRTVLDQYQVRDGDWRWRAVLSAHLRPEWVGDTMMALVRTPMGQLNYRTEDRVLRW
ncbi:hypothetical protein CcrColossus_gp438 [Caulobacter phage CcrColossus]|uniref:Uncharacterized protein n=1 Tax=Caulobacter phage CcrColossus TaxID=1211640 RepID=K4JWM3_9CAUD|nr:hypothetical protein CcrColossus_gp438 [Caulobacter phage CcrColossus]AFU88308.1 hypothetical protein CcrColossus_gp438 [Caulobacter phage CcrColossus]